MAAVLEVVPGLERLLSLEAVKVVQQYSSYKCNSYVVLNGEEVLYNLIEEPSESGFSAGHRRGFHMDGLDNDGNKIFSLRRPGMCLSDKIELFVNDVLQSVVRMEKTCLTPLFSINDAQDVPVLRLKGKISTIQNHYQLQTATKTVIGNVEKIDRGWRGEMLTRKDDYNITFPADLAVHFKLAVVVATILVDFRFHECRR